MTGITQIEQASDCLKVTFSDGVTAAYDYFWLRDHATDCESYDARSHQRELYTASIDPGVVPICAELADGSVRVSWPGVGREAIYSPDFLIAFRSSSADLLNPMSLGLSWNSKSTFDRATISFDDALASSGEELGVRLAPNGFLLVTGCPLEEYSAQMVAQKFGYVRHTLFGGIWTFSDNEAMADSAYTPKLLRPHTDGTYSHDAPGLQLLLCLHYEAEGGYSTLADGLRIYQQMQSEVPDLASVLMQVSVPGQYIGDGSHLRAERPVFRCDESGKLRQVSFNNYDRAPFRVEDELMQQFYRALRYFDQLANDESMQWRRVLAPGEMIVFDNWRLLHGRTAYAGQRKMAGCYVNREDYESCLRTAQAY